MYLLQRFEKCNTKYVFNTKNLKPEMISYEFLVDEYLKKCLQDRQVLLAVNVFKDLLLKAGYFLTFHAFITPSSSYFVYI